MKIKLIENIKARTEDRKNMIRNNWNFVEPVYVISGNELKELESLLIELLGAMRALDDWGDEHAQKLAAKLIKKATE